MPRPLFTPTVISFNRYGAGLGNRVRAVLGAKSLADAEARQLVYVWPVGKAFGPRLSDLWQFSAPVIPRAASRAIAPIWPYQDHTLDWLTDDRRRDRVWQIRTAHELLLPATALPWTERFRALSPVPAVADRVTSFFDQNLRGRPYVGVMIRAHTLSHAKTLEASPVDWFVTQMQQLRHDSPDLTFFVSSDVPEVAGAVADAVPAVVSQADKGPYNSVAGVQAAVADLYLLASSGYLLGPHWSSFVELAEHLAGDRVTLRTSQEVRGSGGLLRQAVPDPLRPWHRPT